MTIKEVEQLLEVPRATIRFYEKQGLISPARGENGYRDYTDEDVETLKKIIILRKIGMTVEEISDLFDGIQSMNKALDANIENLQKQMDELKGAIKLSQKMKEDIVQIDSMDVNAYWHTIEEEEKQGNRFIDITKDIIEIERGVFTSYLSCTDRDGKPYQSYSRIILNVIIYTAIAGIMICLFEKSWSAKNFWFGIQSIVSIMILEMVLSIPLYFLGKKYKWIRNNRRKALYIVTLIFASILLIWAFMRLCQVFCVNIFDFLSRAN